MCRCSAGITVLSAKYFVYKLRKNNEKKSVEKVLKKVLVFFVFGFSLGFHSHTHRHASHTLMHTHMGTLKKKKYFKIILHNGYCFGIKCLWSSSSSSLSSSSSSSSASSSSWQSFRKLQGQGKGQRRGCEGG